MVYFGDIYTCVKCKEAKGICMIDDIERPQNEYIALADKHIEENGIEVLHVSRDDRTCQDCIAKAIQGKS